MTNKTDLVEDARALLNADTRNLKCEDHADLVVEVINNAFILGETAEQDVEGRINFKAAIDIVGINALGASVIKYRPASNASTSFELPDDTLLNKKIANDLYWRRWFLFGTQDGVESLSLLRSNIEDIDDERDQAIEWSEHGMLDGDISIKTYEIPWFEVATRWNDFFPIAGLVSVVSTFDEDNEGRHILTFTVKKENESEIYEATLIGGVGGIWSGWKIIKQVAAYSNVGTAVLGSSHYLSVKTVVTGKASVGNLEAGQAVTMVAGLLDSAPKTFVPGDATKFITGIVTKDTEVASDGSTVWLIATAPGLYELDMDMSGQDNHAYLYLNIGDTFLSFTQLDEESSRWMGYKVGNLAYLFPAGSNHPYYPFAAPNVDGATILTGWVQDEDMNASPDEADIDFSATNTDAEYETREDNVDPSDMSSHKCVSVRPEPEVGSYNRFFMAIPSSLNLDIVGIYVESVDYTDDCEVSVITREGVSYDVVSIITPNDLFTTNDATLVLNTVLLEE